MTDAAKSFFFFFGEIKKGKKSRSVVWKNSKLYCNSIISVSTVMRGSFLLVIPSLLKLPNRWLRPMSPLGSAA